MEKISVIIPMYNAQDYIGQCLFSVLHQTYLNLEILVIDDGSTDKSVEICRGFCREDDRIRLLLQEHGGVSAARNGGLDAATGEYLFFLDSDDMIHPYLLEELAGYMHRNGTELVFCKFLRLEEGQIEGAFHRFSTTPVDRSRGKWEEAKIDKNKSRFYKKHSGELLGIGGKLIQKDIIGQLRFDENIKRGEDTLFLQELFDKNLQIGCCLQHWYYYRMRLGSLSHSGKKTIETYIGIRDREFESGRLGFAFVWENTIFYLLKKNYTEAVRKKERQRYRRIKEKVLQERRHPMYRKLSPITRSVIWLCFYCHPLYVWFIEPFYRKTDEEEMLPKNREGIRRELGTEMRDTGILTFHCSDNYGAMLQAYGLKQYCHKIGIEADIVRYEPPFLTGRHWWIPYVPVGGGRKILKTGLIEWKVHRTMGSGFFRLRTSMRDFRKKYLIEKGQRKIYFVRGLRKLPYRYYIVGSDQIWNPDITLGLRKAYFGAFVNPRKEKVIAYGASLGGSELSPKYDREFQMLLQSVDAVSLREAEAISYVKRLYQKQDISSVIDPVFLLQKEEWQKLEKKSGKKGFLFVYMTEYNQELTDFARNLAKDRKLNIVEVKKGKKQKKRGFLIDNTAGPGEFLGYIHEADYVITNSFHGTAFSIIYEKQFLVFQHSSLGARISNILKIHGLEERLYDRDHSGNIDSPIDWGAVRERTAAQVEKSRRFLTENVTG